MSSSEATFQEPARGPENENDSELVDRIRRTALGHSLDDKSRRNAQLAFDTSLDLETRMRMIAKLSALDPPETRPKKKSRWTWMQIPVGILLVFGLGAGLSRRAASPNQEPSINETSTREVSAATPGNEVRSSAAATAEKAAAPNTGSQPNSSPKPGGSNKERGSDPVKGQPE